MAKKSFSLIEVLLAVAIFSFVASFFIFLMIESYKINERARDMMLATVLAEEGIEAVRSIRDINFTDLILTNRTFSKCLAIENDRWVLKTKIEKIGRRNVVVDCIESINKFSRKVFIDGSGNRRNIAVIVSWQPISGPTKEIKLFTRLTNWRR